MTRISTFLAAAFALALVGCGDKDDTAATSDCDNNGYFDADHGHCHCDDGYSLTDGGMGCEANGANEGGDTGEE